MIALLALSALAGDIPRLTLDQAMSAAEERPAVRAEYAQARAARLDASSAWLAATVPSLGGTLATDSRTRELAIETPIGPFVQQPKDVVTAGARVSVPLLDPARLFAYAPAASALARARHHAADRASDLARIEVAEAWSALVGLEARLRAALALESSLLEIQARTETLMEQGLAVRADALRVQASLAELRAGIASLEAGREAARHDLGRLAGMDGLADADPATDVTGEPETLDQAVAAARASRPDLLALEEQIRAATFARAEPWLEGLPQARLVGQATWTDNSTLVDGAWVLGGIELSWTPVASGTRIPRVLAASERLSALRHQQREAVRGLTAELAARRAALVGVQREVQALAIAVEQGEEASRLMHARYAQGLVPLVDVVSVDATLAEQRARWEGARAEAQVAAAVWWVATRPEHPHR